MCVVQLVRFAILTRGSNFPFGGAEFGSVDKWRLGDIVRSICRNSRVLKRIPRTATHLVATKLVAVLSSVMVKNDSSSWARLFKFCRRCLAQPQRGGHLRSLASVVIGQLEDEADPINCPLSSRSPEPMQFLAKRVSTKLAEGITRCCENCLFRRLHALTHR